jgi:hypothetical protein
LTRFESSRFTSPNFRALEHAVQVVADGDAAGTGVGVELLATGLAATGGVEPIGAAPSG